MTYKITLPTDEPCDIYLAAKQQVLYCVVATSTSVWKNVLGAYESSAEFVLGCSKHSFAHDTLEVYAIDDFALIDGSACYTVEPNDKIRRAFNELFGG